MIKLALTWQFVSWSPVSTASMSLNAANCVRAKVNHSSLRPHRFQTRASDANGARCKTQARAQTGKKCFKKKNCVSVYVTLCLLHTTKLGACVEFNGSLFMSEQNSAPQPISSNLNVLWSVLCCMCSLGCLFQISPASTEASCGMDIFSSKL